MLCSQEPCDFSRGKFRKRLTSKRTWNEAKQDLVHELGYQYIWERLNEIENILGDEYDIEHLKELVERMKEREK